MSGPLSNITIEKKVGKGAFGEILLAHTSDGKQLAIKKIPHAKNQAQNIIREVKAGKELSHKNISRFITQTRDQENEYLIYDYISGKQS